MASPHREEAAVARRVEDEAWVQLATRIPKQLHRDLKLHCVRSETSLMDFVVEALEERLARTGRKRRASAQ